MTRSILSKCVEKKLDGNYKYTSKVILNISLGEYKVLAKILCKNVSFLYKLGLGDLIRDELVKDVRTVKTILEKSEKEIIK